MTERLLTTREVAEFLGVSPETVLRREGVAAKSHTSLYRPNDRGWVKVKNPNYWRRDAEREAMARKHQRRARTRV